MYDVKAGGAAATKAAEATAFGRKWLRSYIRRIDEIIIPVPPERDENCKTTPGRLNSTTGTVVVKV